MTSGTSTQLTPAAPLGRRLMAWADERFPIAGTTVLLLCLYAAALLYGRAISHRGRLHVSLADLGAFFAVWSFFLMIRVIDEHKDYKRDLVTHPDRVLQRGLVTLGQLRVVGAVAIGIQITVSLLEDDGVGAVTKWWLALIAFVALTAKEFFVGEWLNKRLLLYVLAHLPLWSLAVIWMAQMGARPRSLPAAAAWVALLAFLFAWAADLARRIEPAELGEPGATSYADSFGAGPAAALLGATLAGGAAVAAVMLRVTGERSVAPDLVLALLLAPAAVALWRFRRNPASRSVNRALKPAARLALAAMLVTVAVTLLVSRGLA